MMCILKFFHLTLIYVFRSKLYDAYDIDSKLSTRSGLMHQDNMNPGMVSNKCPPEDNIVNEGEEVDKGMVMAKDRNGVLWTKKTNNFEIEWGNRERTELGMEVYNL